MFRTDHETVCSSLLIMCCFKSNIVEAWCASSVSEEKKGCLTAANDLNSMQYTCLASTEVTDVSNRLF